MIKNIILIVLGTFLLSSCGIIEGDGNIVKQDRGTFDSYRKVIISGFFDVKTSSVPSANDQKVTVETDGNIQEYISVYQENEILYLSVKKGKNIKPTKIEIEILTPQEVQITNAGSGKVDLSGNEYYSVSVNNSGSGNFYLDGNFFNLDFKNSGSGDITLKGIVSSGIDVLNSGSGDINLLLHLDEIQLKNSGSGDIDASNTQSKQVTVNNSGSGKCKVEAIEELYVTISGSGNIYYKGSPSITKDITGSGKLKKLD